MPELPDVTVYVESLERRIVGRRLESIRIASPALLRTVDPSPSELAGRRVVGVRRLGKRVVLGLEETLFCVIHLMIAGRLRWRDGEATLPRRLGLAAFYFEAGTLLLTEAGTKRRASLHVLRGEDALATLDPGGLEVLEADAVAFRTALLRENHTLKRALTDPRLFSGIGNAYSDEILHRARLSPVTWTERLSQDEIGRLQHATVEVLEEWTERLRRDAAGRFPEKVTAFRPEMAVHGRHRQPCPECGAPVQRIVYAESETNYCAPCQTGGKLLADRALSRLLRKDWPRTIEELEARRTPRSSGARPSASEEER
jgi:formamidopyrimidine-DNA glycosylase